MKKNTMTKNGEIYSVGRPSEEKKNDEMNKNNLKRRTME